MRTRREPVYRNVDAITEKVIRQTGGEGDEHNAEKRELVIFLPRVQGCEDVLCWF